MENIGQIRRELRAIRKLLETEATNGNLGQTDPDTFTCGCAITSFCNHLYLQTNHWRHHFSICSNDHHCFNRWDDTNTIIDSTATQFGNYPKVLIRKFKAPAEHWLVEEECSSWDVRDFMSGWPRTQNPFSVLKHISVDNMIKLSDLIGLDSEKLIGIIYGSID